MKTKEISFNVKMCCQVCGHYPDTVTDDKLMCDIGNGGNVEIIDPTMFYCNSFEINKNICGGEF
jgi:hypothetical protein